MRTKKSFTNFVLPSLFITILIFSSPHLAISAQPGLHVIEWNTSTRTSNAASPFTALDHWVRVIDHDGIADDGSSHTVTVTYPDLSTQALSFNYKIDANYAIYNLWDDSIPQPIDPGTYTGNYVYRVTDVSTAEWSEMTDYVEVDTILPPDESTFSPVYDTPQSITAYFDDVYTNGALYDDFESGFDPTKWESQPSEVTYDSGEVRFYRTWDPESGSIWMWAVNPATINELKGTVRVGSISGDKPWAQIGGTYCHDGGGNIFARVSIRGNEARHKVFRRYWDGDHLIDEDLIADPALGPVTQGNNYELTLDWDQPTATLTFKVIGLDDSVNYEATYTVSGPISPPDTPRRGLGVSCWLRLNTTTPTFDWDEVSEANHYSVRIYGWNGTKIYTGYTTLPPHRCPPGILKPRAKYKYRIYAYKDHRQFEADNVSASDQNKTVFYAGPDEAQDPRVYLHGVGVGTLTTTSPVGTHTFFHIKVHDAQGIPGNIGSVKVLLPDLTTEVSLYLDYNDSDTCAHYRGHFFGPIQSGEYTFTAMDSNGNSHSKTEVFTSDPIDPPSEATLQPANNTVIGDTGVSFDWDDVSGAAFYELKLYDKDLNYLFQIRTTESEYTLPPGILRENSQYRYRIDTRREFYEDNADNKSEVPESTWKSNAFFTNETNGAEPPSLNLDSFGVAVWHGPHPETGLSVHELKFFAMVTDADGVPENIEKVEVTYPDGTTIRLLRYMDMPDWGSNYFTVENYSDPSLIQTGTYSFRVVDFDGHEVTLQDTLSDVVSNVLLWPTNVSPADGTILSNTTLKISWDLVSGAQYYKVRILESWGTGTVHWSGELTQTQYWVSRGTLQPNTTYAYRVYAYRETSGTEVDFYSCNHYWHSTNYHFTTGDAVGDELAVDFGTYGLWHYDGSTWTNPAGWDPDGNMTEWDNGLAVDFGSYGLWNYDGSSWSNLAGWDPDGMEAYNTGLAVDFETYGLWYHDGSYWTSLAGWNPDGNMVAWTGGLAVDFGASYGLWNYDGSSWTSLAGWDPVDMEAYGSGIAVDFDTHGLWYYDGTGWTSLAGWNPEGMEIWGTDLAVDFGTYGLWNYDGSSWASLAGWDPVDMEAYGSGIAVDFDTYGLWYYDGSTWTSLAGWNPEGMKTWLSGLAVDFGTYGLWNYDGSTWTSLSGWNPEDMIDVDLY